jgi:hypothetical protein
MSNEEKDVLEPETEETPEEEVDTPEEAPEDETEVEEEDSEDSDDSEDSGDSELTARLEALEKENKTLKIQKAKLKEKVAKPQKSKRDTPKKSDSLTREEAILFAKGLTEEEVEKVLSIAKIEGDSPLVAAESDYFKHWKEKEDKRRESEETQLGASRGSAKAKPKKDFNTPGLKPEEHKELFKQFINK